MTLGARTGISGLEAGGLGASVLCDSQPGPYRLCAQDADPPTQGPDPGFSPLGPPSFGRSRAGTMVCPATEGTWGIGCGQPGVPTARVLHQ